MSLLVSAFPLSGVLWHGGIDNATQVASGRGGGYPKQQKMNDCMWKFVKSVFHTCLLNSRKGVPVYGSVTWMFLNWSATAPNSWASSFWKVDTKFWSLALSTPNTTNDVLLNSPKWYQYFPLNSVGEFIFSHWIAYSVWSIPIFSQQNNWFCIDIVRRWMLIKRAGAERVKIMNPNTRVQTDQTNVGMKSTIFSCNLYKDAIKY